MTKPNIWVVVPSVRPDMMCVFHDRWTRLFLRHAVTLAVVWDGDNPTVQVLHFDDETPRNIPAGDWEGNPDRDLVCRRTRAVCNLGFLEAAKHKPDYVLTLDDDVAPLSGDDPIQAHLDVLNRRVPISWMNTAMGDLYLRGVPYSVRDEARVMVSHGVWKGTPDFDGQTQLALQGTPDGVPSDMDYYRGPVPAGVNFPFCGMNAMVRREALPHFYFAPMGPDSGFPNLHRFEDIWMGNRLKEICDTSGWAMYTGASTVLHTRASDAAKNAEQEKLGIEWNEHLFGNADDRKRPADMRRYWRDYNERATKYAAIVSGMLK